MVIGVGTKWPPRVPARARCAPRLAILSSSFVSADAESHPIHAPHHTAPQGIANCFPLLFSRKTDDFQARSSDELSLGKGDRVELIERDDEFGDGWYLGRHLVNNNTGLFPEGLFKPNWQPCL